ncbi:unnamed protein product [Phaedon cochleariae]|uniref:phosphatidylinositol-3,5-bisphosphate 3-phosphatase n=1 Tax=Phaedon cochleariae TaxID=80249 RepID=A0A9N9SI61_PHACE|nr:unnamed protein product [Phaedon cochleariae]
MSGLMKAAVTLVAAVDRDARPVLVHCSDGWDRTPQIVKLVQHTYSNLFGTFLCNTQKERSKIVDGKTFSVWDFLGSPCFRNHLYSASTNKKIEDDVEDCSEGNLSVENVIKSEIDRISSDVTNIFISTDGETEKTVCNGNVDHIDNDASVTDNNGKLNGDRKLTAVDVGTFLDMERSGETSTGTLVGDEIICGNQSGSDRRSKCSSATQLSSTNNGWDSSLHNFSQPKNMFSYHYPLGEDGLVTLKSAVQERLNQILEDYNRKVELLEKELHITRQNLIKQSRLRCNHNDCEQDDNNSVVESVCSTSEGEGHASAGESLRSELSWVAVDEGSAECQRTLWVPDHAVNRRCGRIFCADCSENSTPLPSEDHYNPVRVCTNCYSEMQHDCVVIPNQCKHTNNQPSTANTQIAASSN